MTYEQKRATIQAHLNEWLKLPKADFDKLTDTQKRSAVNVIMMQGAEVKSAAIYGDDYLGIEFPHIFIGIEKDGYAHS